MTVDPKRFFHHLKETIIPMADWLTTKVPQHRNDIHSVCRMALIDVLRRHSHKDDEEVAKIAKRAARNQGLEYLVTSVKTVSLNYSSYRKGTSSPLDVEEVPISFFPVPKDINYDPIDEYENLIKYVLEFVAVGPRQRNIVALRAEGIGHNAIAETLNISKTTMYEEIEKLRTNYRKQRHG